MREYVRQSWNRTLQETVARNGRVSLRKSFDGDETDAPPRFPSRLLTLGGDGTILVQRPDRAGGSALCQLGVRVDLILPDGPQCWAGRCTVQSTLSYPLNDKQTVHAVQLSPATTIWSAQRRRYYRVDAAGSGLDMVSIVPTGYQADTAPLPIGDPEKAAGHDGFEAVLHDISGGGMGLRVDATGDLAHWARPGLAFRCVFRLPGDKKPLDVPAVLARTERVGNRLLHLGMSFQLDDPAAQRRLEDRLTRFATRLEREQLHRQRGA